MEYEVYRAAGLLAAIKTGALKAEGVDISLRIRNCAYDYVAAAIRCPLTIYSVDGEVSAEAVEAALAELRSGARAVGAIILWNGRYIELVPPYYYRSFRRLINNVMELTLLHNTDAVIKKLRSHPTRAAAILAAAEVGNWVAVLSFTGVIEALFMDLEDHNISTLGKEIEAVGGRIDIILPRRDTSITLSVTTARPPRAREREFNTAYSRWYKRAASAARLLPYPRY